VCGRIEVAPIGFPPPEAWPSIEAPTFLLEKADAREPLKVRVPDSNKGLYGHVLIVAGSPGKSGAATLCSRAAMRAGVGLCTLASRTQVVEGALGHTPELMGVSLPGDGGLGRSDADALVAALEKKSAWVVGPGMPHGDETRALLLDLLSRISLPCVLDADALNTLATGNMQDLRKAAGPLVLTPHPGEMARLMKTDVPTVQADRFGMARKLATSTGAIVVLKGARTIVAAPDGRCFVNPTGNPGMATGGTGDVLAGLCGALLAQKIPAVEAACAAVYIHGLAGDIAEQKKGQLGLVASDVVDSFADVWTQWHR
jgi:NAD(P)H-hydrate epimerase